MKIIDENLLQEFREKTVCEWCPWRGPTDPHHIFSKGAGRLDVSVNLVSLCRLCHSKVHAANSKNNVRPKKADLLELVAKREGTTVEAITDKIHRLRRDTKCKVWKVS
jgi:hypothetical protein